MCLSYHVCDQRMESNRHGLKYEAMSNILSRKLGLIRVIVKKKHIFHAGSRVTLFFLVLTLQGQ